MKNWNYLKIDVHINLASRVAAEWKISRNVKPTECSFIFGCKTNKNTLAFTGTCELCAPEAQRSSCYRSRSCMCVATLCSVSIDVAFLPDCSFFSSCCALASGRVVCYCLVFPNARLSAWLYACTFVSVFIYNYQLFHLNCLLPLEVSCVFNGTNEIVLGDGNKSLASAHS